MMCMFLISELKFILMFFRGHEIKYVTLVPLSWYPNEEEKNKTY